MKLSVNTFQRITLSNIIGAIEGNAQMIRKATRLLDALELSDDEKRQVGLEAVATSMGIQYQWKDAAHVWEIEIADDNLAALLKQRLTDYVWPIGSLSTPDKRRDINALLDQFDIRA